MLPQEIIEALRKEHISAKVCGDCIVIDLKGYLSNSSLNYNLKKNVFFFRQTGITKEGITPNKSVDLLVELFDDYKTMDVIYRTAIGVILGLTEQKGGNYKR